MIEPEEREQPDEDQRPYIPGYDDIEDRDLEARKSWTSGTWGW